MMPHTHELAPVNNLPTTSIVPVEVSSMTSNQAEAPALPASPCKRARSLTDAMESPSKRAATRKNPVSVSNPGPEQHLDGLDNPTEHGQEKAGSPLDTHPGKEESTSYQMDEMDIDVDDWTPTQPKKAPTVITISSDEEEPAPQPARTEEKVSGEEPDEDRLQHFMDWLDEKLFDNTSPLADLQQHIMSRRASYRHFQDVVPEDTPERSKLLQRLQREHEEYKESLSITIFGIRRLGMIRLRQTLDQENYDLDSAMTFATETSLEVEAAITKIKETFPTDPLYIREYINIRRASKPSTEGTW